MYTHYKINIKNHLQSLHSPYDQLAYLQHKLEDFIENNSGGDAELVKEWLREKLTGLERQIQISQKQTAKAPNELESDAEINILLQQNFNLADFELDTLICNLTEGQSSYVPLTFKEGHNQFLIKLKRLRKLGIDRNEIARVFSKCFVYKNQLDAEGKQYPIDYIRTKV